MDGKIGLLADGSRAFTKAFGLGLDLMGRGLGRRSRRFAFVAEDKKIIHLAVEALGDFDVGRAEAVLEVV